MVNPTAGCRVQQTCRQSKGGSSDPPSAEETVEAGRNGKNGTSPGRGSPGPKPERRFRREWTQRRSCRRRGIDEPHERSPVAGFDLRVAPRDADRANRYVSEQEPCRSLDPMRSTHGKAGKPNDLLRTGCQ